jgi:hypothetical protein
MEAYSVAYETCSSFVVVEDMVGTLKYAVVYLVTAQSGGI